MRVAQFAETGCLFLQHNLPDACILRLLQCVASAYTASLVHTILLKDPSWMLRGMAGARSPRFENWIQGSRKASGSNLLGPRNQIQVCFYFNNILSPPKKNNHKKIGLTWMIPYTSKKMNENLSNVVSTSMAITLLFFFLFLFFL